MSDSRTQSLIHFSGASKSFGMEEVLAPLDLNIKAGEFVSFIGPSGCGKSTLLRIVAGLETLSSGSCTVSQEPSRNSLSSAFVFQDASLLPWRTVLKNVELPLEFTSLAKSERTSRSIASLKRVGLNELDFGKYPKALSGGMKMRVSLARALVTSPKLLLMDEPFGALDDILRTELNDQLHQLRTNEGWTVLFVTHNIAEAVYLSDRVLIMSTRPARIVEQMEVPFGRERDERIRFSPRFVEICRETQESLKRALQS